MSSDEHLGDIPKDANLQSCNQLTLHCPKSTIEKLGKGVKYVQI